jgi:ribosome-binding ATPase YchF (GTP1/OBG family)
MLIGVCGKSNTGKTTMFSAMTLVDAEISNRIFTTIKPNVGIAYVRADCPCKSLGAKCNPQNSKCVNGTRLVPIRMIDVAGLVPDAHKGRGLGNKFLSDVMEASVIINVVDISGSTDDEGIPVQKGSHDPAKDIEFFQQEIDYWILGILQKGAALKRPDLKKEEFAKALYKQLSGLGIKLEYIEEAVNQTSLALNSSDDKYLEFIEILRKTSKPIIIAANKIDVPGAEDLYLNVKKHTNERIVPCSAESELALRRADQKGLIRYVPGASDFEIIAEMDSPHKKALEFIRENVLKKYGSTGVQHVLDNAVFDLLDMMVVYPVENEHKLTDKKGNVLPDAILMKKGSNALDLAFRVHEDIGKKFIAAVDARTGKHISAAYELKNGDIISIKAGK